LLLLIVGIAVEGGKRGADVGEGVRLATISLWLGTAGMEVERAKPRAVPGGPIPLLDEDDDDDEDTAAAAVEAVDAALRLWPTVMASRECTPPRAGGEPDKGSVYHSTAVMRRGSMSAVARASPVPVRVRKRPVSRDRNLMITTEEEEEEEEDEHTRAARGFDFVSVAIRCGDVRMGNVAQSENNWAPRFIKPTIYSNVLCTTCPPSFCLLAHGTMPRHRRGLQRSASLAIDRSKRGMVNLH